MRKLLILSVFVLMILAILAIGCAPKIRCEAPSKIIGNKCCLDTNDNNICDTDEDMEAEPEPEPAEETETEPEQAEKQEPEPVEEEAEEAEEAVEEESGSDFQDYLDSLSAPERTKVKMVRQLVQEAMEREENYFYRYTGPRTMQQEFWIRGDKLKTQILEPVKLDKFTHYNMVYIDLVEGTAEGYCEPEGDGKCWKGHGPYEETVMKNMKKTPKDWLEELGDEFHYVSQNKINDVLYYIVDYPTEEGLYRVYLESWRGWPYRIELYKTADPGEMGLDAKPDDRWIYQHLDIGAVMEDELVPDRRLATMAED